MRFGVLGPLVVWDDAGEPVTVPEAKVRALLADLLVHEGAPVPTDRLVQDLWGDAPPGNPAGALQAKVSQLRRVLGKDRVQRRPPGYRLVLDGPGPEVDAGRFRALVTEARTAADPHTRAALLTQALGLWRGAAYADFADEEFVRAAAQRLGEQRLSALEEQAEARLLTGDHLLLGELAGLVVAHPLRERLRALQMRALYRAGRQSEALAAYEDLRARLAADLGIDPAPELARLHRAVLRQDPALAEALPAAVPLPPPSTTAPRTPPSLTAYVGAPEPAAGALPLALTPLVGRERELARLGRLLTEARLVTLTGAGGVGKTSLALAAARAQEDPPAGAEPPPDVRLVELSGLRGPAGELARAVGAALGLRDDVPASAGARGGAAASPAQRLALALRGRRTLLVLDNCEHVVEAAAELAGLLLRSTPGLRVLATSQDPLGLAGEVLLPVEPLAPEDAVLLFTERAADSDPRFPRDPREADPGDREAVAEICRRLDGIPLALELAATRVRALGVRELALRLGDRFTLLTSHRRDVPARQRTLRAVLDWSWELLSGPERVVLRRLAAHSDGCALDAAEDTCSGDGVDRREVLPLLVRLVDRSLVVVSEARWGRRYRLPESVAAYAGEHLNAAAESAAVRERHLRHYRALAERAEPHLCAAGRREWLGRLDAEAGNLRGALEEAVRRARSGATEDRADAVRLATSLTWWWLLRGRLTEARRALTAVRATYGRPGGDRAEAGPAPLELVLLEHAFALLTGDRTGADTIVPAVPDAAPAAGRGRTARALWLCAHGLYSAGAVAGAEELNDRAHAAFAETDDRWGNAAALGLRATLALARGDLAAVARDGLLSARIFRELGDIWGQLQTVLPLAVLAEIKGEYDEAARRQREGLDLAREGDLPAEVSLRLSGLGRLALLARDWDRAEDLHEQARRLAVAQGFAYGEIHAEMGLALGARRRGDLDTAERHLLHLRDSHAEASSPAGDHLLCAELGFLAELREDARGASLHHLRGWEVARALDEPRALALSLEGLAGAAALSGDTPGAARAALLLGAADAARRGAGAPLPPAERADVDRVTAAARGALGPAAFDAAFARGAELAPREAVFTPPPHCGTTARHVPAEAPRTALPGPSAPPARGTENRPDRPLSCP
ncbi:BTAD domain-containing putative transcriptional regulator [Streptomyces sp. NPDC007088]|uniref:AfsR/SARP family transcriptional regulator n=1 Tax=Streptomyces sp. NPDC007088 TaxID=3364773 RepID=UPI0036B00D81